MEQRILDMQADFFTAISHPTRIKILELLKGKDELCVCEIVSMLSKEQSNISRHLSALKKTGVIDSRIEGVKTLYKVRDQQIYKILDSVKGILRKQVRDNQQILKSF